jgi:hypothetical protein
MFWEEKIDRLKKKFSQADFNDPFMNWSDILKKTEARFIINHDPNERLVNWADKIKDKKCICTLAYSKIYQQIKKLDVNKNYWVMIVEGPYPTSRHLVYDCKSNAMEWLISIARGNFYIVDKKYAWFIYFESNQEKKEITLYKSGHEPTPFDQ